MLLLLMQRIEADESRMKIEHWLCWKTTQPTNSTIGTFSGLVKAAWESLASSNIATLSKAN